MKLSLSSLVLLALSSGPFAAAPGNPLGEEKALAEAKLSLARPSSLPSELVLGDWDEDGHLDLAVANNAGLHGVALFLADGHGGFRAPEMVGDAVGFCATHLVRGDFDHDHHQDLALLHAKGVTLLRGTGKGTFSWFGGEDVGEIDPAHARVELDADEKPPVPSVLLYAGLLILNRGQGELVYTNLAVDARGIFAQDPDGGEDGTLDGDDDQFIPE